VDGKLAVVLTALALFAGTAVAQQQREAPPAASRAEPVAAYACFDMKGLLPEAPPPFYLLQERTETLHDLLARISRARQDPAVAGLIVRVGPMATGWAKAQEIRRALMQCRRDGKDVVCYLEGSDTMSYYLATGGRRVVMPPMGSLMLVGVRAEAVFARDLLDKIGVAADFVQAGRYKTAGETLTRSEPSPEFRESVGSVLDDYYEQLLDGIAEGRGVPVSQAAAVLRRGPFTARQAKAAGLVDDVVPYERMVSQLGAERGGAVRLVRNYGRKAAPPVTKLSPMQLLGMLFGGMPRPRPRATGASIAVIYAVGPIVREEPEGAIFGSDVTTAERLTGAIREAADDENVKAIVLRVDSPGGSAAACDEIWHQLRLADGRKPVIASLSDTAASGGYYIAAGARKIIADPGCLTGSIGVFGGKLVVRGLFEKLGLNVAVFERGGRTGIMSLFSEFSTDERRKVKEIVEEVYRIFLERVAETRPGMSVADVERVAAGRIWTGRQARENGLVDALGGLRDAIAAAKEAAGLPVEKPVTILRLPRQKSIMELLLSGGVAQRPLPGLGAGLSMLPGEAMVRSYLDALGVLRSETVLCLTPALLMIR